MGAATLPPCPPCSTTHATTISGLSTGSEISGPCANVEWHFGDGSTSADRNPEHVFACAGGEFKDYQVGFRAVSPSGKAAEAAPQTIRVWVEKKARPPQARFRILSQNARAGDNIQLADESQGQVDGWEWEILGESTSVERNPAIGVTNPGKKTIRLKVKGPGGTSEATQTIVISPRYEPVKAKAKASPESGTAPLKVQMTSQISGEVTSVRWQFGDGQFSTNASPIHTFNQASNYPVVLVVYPADPAQRPHESRLSINVRRPTPAWAKLLAFVGCVCLIVSTAGLILHQRRKAALRLSVHFWPEDSTTCHTFVFTRANELRDVSPRAPIQIKREGRTSLSVEPVPGASLLDAGGKELTIQSIGQGARILVRSASGTVKAVTVSAIQKPLRPTPFSEGCDPFCDKHEVAAAEPGEFDWGWETGGSIKTN